MQPWCGTTLLDGELVLDLDPHTKKHVLRYYVFDLLVYDRQNIMNRNLEARYGVSIHLFS